MTYKNLTPTMKRAIRWLEERGGYAVLDSRARMLAEGEVANFDPSTWLRLMVYGHIAPDDIQRGHVHLTYTKRSI